MKQNKGFTEYKSELSMKALSTTTFVSFAVFFIVEFKYLCFLRYPLASYYAELFKIIFTPILFKMQFNLMKWCVLNLGASVCVCVCENFIIISNLSKEKISFRLCVALCCANKSFTIL